MSKIEELVAKYGFKEITPEVLQEANLVGKTERIKVLARGEIKSGITVKAHAFSEKAKEAIEKAGGNVETV